LFQYQSTNQNSFPICITDEAEKLHPCHENDYTMTDKMKLEFTFLRASKDKAASNKCFPADFIWKYEMELITPNKIVHGYFKLSSEKKTVLNLATKYDEPKKLKWIRFTCFDPNNPQRRAWFIPVKGLAFPPSAPQRPSFLENLNPFHPTNSNECEPSTKRTTHHIAKLRTEEGLTIEWKETGTKETPDYFNEIWAVESKDLKFLLDGEPENNLMYCYFVQVCSHQQDMDLLEKHYKKIGGKDSKIAEDGYARKINHAKLEAKRPGKSLPERYLQNVQGYFKLKPKENDEQKTVPTRIDLCNSWDKNTVATSTILPKKTIKTGQFVSSSAIDTKKAIKTGKFVFFYAIKFNQSIPEPVKIKEAPKSILSKEVTNEDDLVKSTSEIIPIEYDCFTCEMQEDNPNTSMVSL
jgi:hypothetical protein